MSAERERFRRLMDRIGDALAVPAAAREAHLRAHCEPDLLPEALDLLRREEEGGDLDRRIEEGLAGDAAALVRDLGAGRTPRVASYEILEVLGEGGMGVVYRARQTGPLEREVALKLIRVGPGAARLVERFEAERRVLARMEHPGIAAIHEAGATEEGRPWYSMELVEGRPITEHCDAERLDLEERLRLFIQVCDAVQHAHHKGVIHRDLKSSNVLVSRESGVARPKVIDFGIAQLVEELGDPARRLTAEGMLVGTLESMSPEQLGGRPGRVDARSDIYALGVLLYELICGRLPFDGARLRDTGLAEAARLLQEEEPPLPSTRLHGADGETAARLRRTRARALARRLRGDLDQVVRRALEKDPRRRYQTAHELAEEIGRYLRFEPVLATAPTRRYRLARFVRRHRVGVGAATAVLLALVAGTILAGMGLLRARQAERQATAEAATSRATTRFLQEMLASVQPDQARGREVSVREVLTEARRKLDEEEAPGDDPLVEAALRFTIGDSYQALGDLDTALPQLETARGLYEREVGVDDPRTQECYDRIGMVQWLRGDLDASLATANRLLEIRRRLYGEEDSRTTDALNNVANTYADMGRLDRAEELLRRIVAVDRRLYAASPGDFLCFSLNNLATVLADEEKWDEAMALHRESIALRREWMGEDSPAVIIARLNLGFAQRGAGDLEAAERTLEAAAETAQRVLGSEHVRTAVAWTNLAAVQAERDRMEAAEANARRALAAMGAASGADSYRTGQVHALLGSVLLKRERYEGAAAQLDTAYALCAAGIGADDARTRAIAARRAELERARGRELTAAAWEEKARP